MLSFFIVLTGSAPLNINFVYNSERDLMHVNLFVSIAIIGIVRLRSLKN